jgi:hypothetical protein
MFVSRIAVPLLAIVALTAWTQPALAGERLVWSYEGGFFADKDKKNWIEENPTGKYFFKEVDRNEDYIELYDKSRDCTVRLYKDAMYLKGLGQFNDFVKLYDGEWTK